jgi:hypothetical protein
MKELHVFPDFESGKRICSRWLMQAGWLANQVLEPIREAYHHLKNSAIMRKSVWLSVLSHQMRRTKIWVIYHFVIDGWSIVR